jgi:sugar fermentation stimulation protein A
MVQFQYQYQTCQEKTMHYLFVKEGIFIDRPNRFIAHVLIDNREEIVHVKNTGRCRELFVKNAQLLLEQSSNPNRKTRYSLISVWKNNGRIINVDSQAPNVVVYEGIKDKQIIEIGDAVVLKREVTYGGSRFDFYFETDQNRGFIEVKGVTLENDGVAMFPDAPTKRGTKHIYEMINAVKNGYQGYIFFLIQMKKVKYFMPNKEMDINFSRALQKAWEAGVNILAYDCDVSTKEITLGNKVKVVL